MTVRVGTAGEPAEGVTESVEVARYPASFVGRDGTDFALDGEPRDHGDSPLGIFPGDESTREVIEGTWRHRVGSRREQTTG